MGGRVIGDISGGPVPRRAERNASWAGVKGNGRLVQGDCDGGTDEDGFQAHRSVEGRGTGSVFCGDIDLGGSAGVGINGTAEGNTTACDDLVTSGPLIRKDGCS